MENLTPKQITDSEQFLPRLEAAVSEIIAVRDAKRDGRPTGRPQGVVGFLNEKRDGLGYHFSKARRKIHNFAEADYRFISDRILRTGSGFPRAGLTADILSELHSCFEAYVAVTKTSGAKRNPYRAPRILSSYDLETRVERLLRGKKLGWYLSNKPAFYAFLVKKIDGPAGYAAQGEAITNARLVCSYMLKNRGLLGLGSDQAFAASISLVARCGAWASQQVGQWDHFNFFKRLIEGQLATGDRVSTVAYNMLCYHDYNRAHFETQSTYASNYASRAYQAYRDLPPGHMGELHDEDATILGNPAHELIDKGFGPLFRSVDTNETIEAMLLSNEERCGDSYTSYERVSDLVSLGKAHLNVGNVDGAYAYRQKAFSMLHIISEQTGRDMPNIRRSALVLGGRIEVAMTGSKNNLYFEEAMRIALKMGAHHRVREIAAMTTI